MYVYVCMCVFKIANIIIRRVNADFHFLGESSLNNLGNESIVLTVKHIDHVSG